MITSGGSSSSRLPVELLLEIDPPRARFSWTRSAPLKRLPQGPAVNFRFDCDRSGATGPNRLSAGQAVSHELLQARASAFGATSVAVTCSPLARNRRGSSSRRSRRCQRWRCAEWAWCRSCHFSDAFVRLRRRRCR